MPDPQTCPDQGAQSVGRYGPVPSDPDFPDRDELDLARSLDLVRSRIEERFLEGGEILGAALDSAAMTRKLLEQVLTALDEHSVNAIIADLLATTRRLQQLPAKQEEQHHRMNALSDLGMALQSHIEDMQETLRYLRTVAVTVKIAGADAPEFGNFANEMLTQIQAGRAQVDGFAVRLGLLLGQAQVASRLHHDLRAEYASSIPDLTRSLDHEAGQMHIYHATLRDLAAAQDELVRRVEGQVAHTLSALQIGDMTRQRVEHVQGGVLLLGEATGAISPQAQRLITAILSHQLSDLVDEFRTGSKAVSGNLAGLAASMAQMTALGHRADGGHSSDGAFLQEMERSMLAAQAITTRIESASLRTDQVSQSAAAIGQELSNAVGIIATIRSEIQFMAINTSLRCRHLGDSGRAIVVVATELRTFATRLEEVAERLLADLGRLAELFPDQPPTNPAPQEESLGTALDRVLNTIHRSHRQMQRDLQMLTAQGEDLTADISHSVARLNFAHELGDALDAAASALTTPADGPAGMDRLIADALPEAAALLAQIRSSYTMARERKLHDRLIGPDQDPARNIAATAQVTSTPRGAVPEEEDGLAEIFF